MEALTKDDLHYYLLLHGYGTDVDKMELTPAVTSYAKAISEMDLSPYDGRELAYISKFQLFQNAERFMKERFRLHPVGYLSNKKLEKILNSRKIRTVDDIPRIYNQSAKMVDPFSIPLDFRIESVFGGRLVAQNVVTEDPQFYEEILPKLNLYFTEIVMPRVLTTVAPTSLVHEITHSQLESQKGIIEDYYNGEVLSIFMEFLHSYETDSNVFTIDFVNRLQNVLVNFYSMFLYNAGKKNPEREYGVYDYYSDAQYFVSIAKAISMIHLYLESDEKIKTYMVQGIQKVFDGKVSVEDFLESIDIHWEDALNPKYPKEMVQKLR